jgi:hypothetical protein
MVPSTFEDKHVSKDDKKSKKWKKPCVKASLPGHLSSGNSTERSDIYNEDRPRCHT